MKHPFKRIAFIYEGISAEDQLLKNLSSVFFDGQTDVSIITCPADGNIYMLWNRLKDDDYNTNVIDVLKEMSVSAKEQLGDLRPSNFSEIYLFFDYDGHSDNIPKEYRNKDILAEMLDVFDNETELGKLYVSYPMVESIREIDAGKAEYRRLHIPLEEIGNYKHSFYTASDFNNYSAFDRQISLIFSFVRKL